jgi:hypothetical protein
LVWVNRFYFSLRVLKADISEKMKLAPNPKARSFVIKTTLHQDSQAAGFFNRRDGSDFEVSD